MPLLLLRPIPVKGDKADWFSILDIPPIVAVSNGTIGGAMVPSGLGVGFNKQLLLLVTILYR